MLYLTQEQLHRILGIIRDYHSAFVANTISPDVLEPDLLQKLADKGLVNVKISSIQDSYLYGQLLAQLNNPAVQKMSYNEFAEWIKKNPIPLSEIEKSAIDAAQNRAGQYCRGLGNKAGAEFNQYLVEADAGLRQKLRDEIRTKTAENIARRESSKQLRSDLGWATKDWARDWDRIAVTEKHEVHQQGNKDYIIKRHGPEALVFKRPTPDACKHCKKLYIGRDGFPLIFKISDLEANGTNVGIKAANWKAIVGSTHPFCQCQLQRIPAGWGFNEIGQMVPKGEFGILVKSLAHYHVLLEYDEELIKAVRTGAYIDYQGIPIHIETQAGEDRRWTDQSGQPGVTHMTHAYGEIVDTVGIDDDPIDVFMGPLPDSKWVYIIDQRNSYNDTYDEQKCMLGFQNEEAALWAYRENYDKPLELTCTPMKIDAFRRWANTTSPTEKQLKKGPTPVVPLQEKSLEKATPNSAPTQENIGAINSPAGKRVPPSYGAGANFFLSLPENKLPRLEKQGQTLNPVAHKAALDRMDNRKIKVDKRVYTEQTKGRIVEPRDPRLYVPEPVKGQVLIQMTAEANRERVEKDLNRRGKIYTPNRTPVTMKDLEEKKKRKKKKDEEKDHEQDKPVLSTVES